MHSPRPITSMAPLFSVQDTYFVPQIQNPLQTSPQNLPAVQAQSPSAMQTTPPSSPQYSNTPQLMQRIAHQATLPSDQLADTLAQRCHEVIYNLIRFFPEHVQFGEIAGSVKYIVDGQDAVKEIRQGLNILTQRSQASDRNNAQQLSRENATLKQQFIQASIYHHAKVTALENVNKALKERIKVLERMNATYQQAMEQLDQDDDEAVIYILHESTQDEKTSGVTFLDR